MHIKKCILFHFVTFSIYNNVNIWYITCALVIILHFSAIRILFNPDIAICKDSDFYGDEKMKRAIIILCLILCITAASFSIWKLYGYYRTYQGGKEEYDQLKDYVREDTPSEKEKKKKEDRDLCPISVDFHSLQKINPDLIGWIYIPGTGIDYPIVQAQDNSAYLHMTFRKKESYVGAIFLDAGCAPDFSDFNSIIYGHNLKNGEMFGHLKRLYDINYNKKANYKKHPDIWILTPDQSRLYRIFACREINAKRDRDVYTINLPAKEGSLSESEERTAFLEKQISRSQIKTGIKLSGMESIITLSTCTSRSREGRFVLQALCRTGSRQTSE